MLKKVSHSLFGAVIIISLISLCGCSSAIPIQNPVVGIIQVVGNEPFTRLAVNLNDKDVYFLECTKEVQAELMKNQQKIYEIDYSEVKKSNKEITLVVTKAIPIKTK